MLTTTFFDHPIASLVTRLSSAPDLVPDVGIVMASVEALRADLDAFTAALDRGDIDGIVVPMLRTYFAAVVLASQAARLPPSTHDPDIERAAGFADHAEAIMRSLGERVGPVARGVAARVLGLSAAASVAAIIGEPGARNGPPSAMAEA